MDSILSQCELTKKAASEACLADQILKKVYALASNPDFFYGLSLEEHHSLKLLLAFIQEKRKYLGLPKIKRLLLKELIFLFNPYVDDPARAFGKLYEILTRLDQPPAERTDIRDVALYDDLIFNPNLHRKLNIYGRSIIAARPYLLPAEPTPDQAKIDNYYLKKDVMDRLTNTGRFLPLLVSIRTSLLEKSRAILRSDEIRQEYQPRLTANEMWVAVHDLRNEFELRRTTLHPRFNSVTKKIEVYLPALKAAFKRVRAQAYENLKPGDFMFSKIQRELAYAGKKPDNRIRAVRFFTWSDYGHVALLLKTRLEGFPNSSQSLNETQKNNSVAELFHTGFQGVSIGESDLEAAYIYDTYRIRLDQLMTPELVTALTVEAEKTGESIDVIFRDKIAQYSNLYRERLGHEYYEAETSGSRVKIKTTVQAQKMSVYYNLSPFSTGTNDIFEAVARERQTDESHLLSVEQDLTWAVLQSNQRLATHLNRVRQIKGHRAMLTAKYPNPNSAVQSKLNSLSLELSATLNEYPEIRRERLDVLLEKLEFLRTSPTRDDQLPQKIAGVEEELAKEKEISEICSEFAFVEYIRYVQFIEDHLKEDFHVTLPSHLHFFDLSFANSLELKGLHPGSLSRILDRLVKNNQAVKLRPGGAGLFAD